MADEKRYFSVKDMFEQAVTRAKTDPRYEEYSKICELDYDLLCSTCKYDKLYRCEFDVVGEVTYGSSEGIYGDIFLYGNWSKERDDPFKSRARVYVLKTLKQDKESYLAVGMLVNLICVTCTPAQYIEIEADFEFYKAAWEEELAIFYSAFISKNDIFPPPELASPSDDDEIDLVRLEKVRAMMSGIDRRTRSKALPGSMEDDDDE